MANGLALDLHDVVFAVPAEIALDDVSRLAGGAIDGDAGIVGVVDVVLRDEIAPRSLLHLDAVALLAVAVVDVIERDDALAHHGLAVVATEIEALGVTVSVVDVIARDVEPVGVGVVGAEADIGGVVNVALVHPDMAALAKPHAMTAAGNFQSAQAEKFHRLALADIHRVLPRIRARDDRCRAFLRHDPDRRSFAAGGLHVPHAPDAISAAREREAISRLKRSDRFH